AGKACDEPVSHGITAYDRDDWNVGGRLLRGQRRPVPAATCNYVHLLAGQFGRQSRQPLDTIVSPAIFNRDIATRNVAVFFQTGLEGGHKVGNLRGRGTVKKADDRRGFFLGARQQRPGDCRSANRSDDLAPPHLTRTSLHRVSGELARSTTRRTNRL